MSPLATRLGVSTLRFCFLTTFYPPFNFGGDGIGIQRLAQALAKRGHQVTVVHDADAHAVLADGPSPSSAPSDPFGVQVITLRSRFPLLNTLLTQQAGHPVFNRGRLRQILASGGFDVLVFNNISLIGGPALLGYGDRAVKIYLAHEHWLVCPTHVLWRHGRERCDKRECLRCQLVHKRPPQLWRHVGLLDHQLRHVDTFIAMSEFSRKKHREFGFPREMKVLPYFLPDPPAASAQTPPRGDSPSNRPYFLFVGRLERIKGLDDILPAFDQYPQADLLVVGDGTHGPVLRKIAKHNSRVRFVGRLAGEELDAYYEHAIALIVPSICFETFGITLIEAFSHGTPVIARRLGPFPEIVEHSGGGRLFDSVEELMVAMKALQDSPEERDLLGRSGYAAYLSRWSESAVVPQFLQIVAEAGGETGARHS